MMLNLKRKNSWTKGHAKSKLGTVNEDVGTAVKNAKSGQVEIRNDKMEMVSHRKKSW